MQIIAHRGASGAHPEHTIEDTVLLLDLDHFKRHVLSQLAVDRGMRHRLIPLEIKHDVAHDAASLTNIKAAQSRSLCSV